jgi:di/tricarboxylate transporter
MDFLGLRELIYAVDWHAVAVLLVAGGTFYLFASERLPVQTTALLALLALMLIFGLVSYERGSKPMGPEVFLAGFGHPALVTICCLMVLGRGLVATGALEPFARLLARAWNFTPQFAFLAMLLFCLGVSGVMNDTPIVVLMMPVLLSVASRTGTHASATLLPMNYAVIIGGMATTIGTSTNLLVVGIAADLGVPTFGLFDFLPIVAVAAAVALPYLWLVLPRLLPRPDSEARNAAALSFEAVLEIRRGGWAEGRELRDALTRVSGLRVLRIMRGGTEVMRLPTVQLRAGDQLIVADPPGELREHAAIIGAHLRATQPRDPGDPAMQILAQVLVTQESEFTGTPTGLARFVEERQLAVIGLHRPQGEGALDPSSTPLKPGDVLLVQGTRDRLELLKSSTGVLVLDATLALPHTRKAPVALLIMAGVVVLAATKLLPMVLAAALGVAFMMLSGCLRWQEATDALSSNVIMIVVGSLALGEALSVTGIMQAAGEGLAWAGGYVHPVVVLAGLMLFMSVVTNFVSNSAAAIIGTPVAVVMATTLGVDPRPFVLAVLFGCNLCFATPMAYQTNLLVMAAAGYRFKDFVRGGLPLLLLLWVTLTWLLAREYGLL